MFELPTSMAKSISHRAPLSSFFFTGSDGDKVQQRDTDSAPHHGADNGFNQGVCATSRMTTSQAVAPKDLI
jgi:hypothetical protein